MKNTRQVNYAKYFMFLVVLFGFAFFFQTNLMAGSQNKSHSVAQDTLVFEKKNVSGSMSYSNYELNQRKIKTAADIEAQVRQDNKRIAKPILGDKSVVFIDGKAFKASDKVSLSTSTYDLVIHRNDAFTKKHGISEKHSAIALYSDKAKKEEANKAVAQTKKDKNKEESNLNFRDFFSEYSELDIEDLKKYSQEYLGGDFFADMGKMKADFSDLQDAFAKLREGFAETDFSSMFDDMANAFNSIRADGFFSFDDAEVEDDGKVTYSEAYYIIINKDTSDKEIGKLIGDIAKMGIDIEVNDVKRNDKGEIYGMQVKLSERKEAQGGSSYSSSSSYIVRTPDMPIQEVKIGKIDGRLSIESR